MTQCLVRAALLVEDPTDVGAMHSRPIVGRAGLIAVLVAVLLATLVTPARAGWTSGTPVLAGSTADLDHIIQIRMDVSIYRSPGGGLPNETQLSGAVRFGRLSTSATGCRFTAWQRLSTTGSSVWEAPRRTHDCTFGLRRGVWSPAQTEMLQFWRGNTSAVNANARGCIDLYYNNSTSSGWQRCADTSWTSVG